MFDADTFGSGFATGEDREARGRVGERGARSWRGGRGLAAGRRALGWVGVVAACAGFGLVGLAAPAWAATDDLDLVSRAAGATGAKGNDSSYHPAISANGRFVAFDSSASNLDPDDGNDRGDVFVRDLQENTVTLVSRAAGADGANGDGNSWRPAISADGRFVVFMSDASNLHPDDGDDSDDVFVRDLTENTTTLISRAAGPDGGKGDGFSAYPAISADGRYVSFASEATNLHPDDADDDRDAYVRDLQENTTTLVSRAAGADGAKGDRDSHFPHISGDGRFVSFDGRASNLHPDDGDTTTDVFVRDLQQNTTTLVSRAAGADGAKGDDDSGGAKISADGRFVAFEARASNLHPDDADTLRDVLVRDLQQNTTTLVSRAAGADGAKGNDWSDFPRISGDGRFVAFQARASNLHPDDADTTSDVFVRDLQENTTTLVSRAAGADGAKGNDDSGWSAISPDGRFVAFDSSASNLQPDDNDTTRDVFRRDVLGPPPQPPPAEQPPAEQRAQPPPGAARAVPQPGCPVRGNVMVAADGADVRLGTAVSDVMFGLVGDDLLRGLGGDDCLYGAHGADRLFGGGGRDRLFGGSGSDRVWGGAGDDVIRPGSGRDRVAAGTGDDRAVTRGGFADMVNCGPGRRDLAIVDRLDTTRACERVRRP